MFNIHVLASQLVFNQSSSPTLESSMTAYLTLISPVASEVKKGEHSNDLKMNQLFKTVPKKFLSVDPTSNVERLAHLNGFVVMLRKMDPVFKATCRNMIEGLYGPYDENLPRVVIRGSPHMYQTPNRNNMLILVDDKLDIQSSAYSAASSLASFNLINGANMFVINTTTEHDQVKSSNNAGQKIQRRTTLWWTLVPSSTMKKGLEKTITTLPMNNQLLLPCTCTEMVANKAPMRLIHC